MDNYLTSNIIEIFRPPFLQDYPQYFTNQEHFKEFVNETNQRDTSLNLTPYLFKYTIEDLFIFTDFKSIHVKDTLLKTNNTTINLIQFNGKPFYFVTNSGIQTYPNQLLVQNIFSNLIVPIKNNSPIPKTFVLDNHNVKGYFCDLPKGNFLNNIIGTLRIKDKFLFAENILKNLKQLLEFDNFQGYINLDTIFVLENSYKDYNKYILDEILIYLEKNLSPNDVKNYSKHDFQEKQINQSQLTIIILFNLLFNTSYHKENVYETIDQEDTWKISSFFNDYIIKQDFKTRLTIILSNMFMKNISLKSFKKEINKLKTLFKEIYKSLNSFISYDNDKNELTNLIKSNESTEILANLSLGNSINLQFSNPFRNNDKELDQLINSLEGVSIFRNKNSIFSLELEKITTFHNEILSNKDDFSSYSEEFVKGNFNNKLSEKFFKLKINKHKWFDNLEMTNEDYFMYNSNNSPLKISFNLSIPFDRVNRDKNKELQICKGKDLFIGNKTYLNKSNFNSRLYLSNRSEDYEVSDETVFEGFHINQYQITIQERLSIVKNLISLIANENLNRFSLYNSTNLNSYVNFKNNDELSPSYETTPMIEQISLSNKPLNVSFNLKFENVQCNCKEEQISKYVNSRLEIVHEQSYNIIIRKHILLNSLNLGNLTQLNKSSFTSNLQISNIYIIFEASNKNFRHTNSYDQLNKYNSFKFLDETHEEKFLITGNKLPFVVKFNLKTENVNNYVTFKKEVFEIGYPNIFQIINNIFIDLNQNMAIFYNLQGDTNYEAGKYEESLFYYLQSLNIYNLNPSTPNTELALSFNNCASSYLKLKDYQNSLEFYQKALEHYEEIYGKEHIITANVWNNMGLIFENVSDHKNSLTCFIKSLKIKKHVLEAKDPTIALGYYNIGKSYEYLNSYDKAEKFYLKSLAIFKINELCLEYATALLSFGLLNDKLGRLKEAVENYDECIWISQKLSVDNILSASAYNYLGLVLIKADLFDDAINNFNSAINIRLKLQGKLNFETASLYNNIACAYFKKEDYDQALLNYTNFINIFIELNQGNEVNDETVTAYNNMGLVYVKKKEFELAVDCFSYSIKIKKQLERKTDQETISIMNNLAGVYFKLKQFVNSLNIYLEIYKTTSSSSTLEEENYNILKYIGHCFLNLDDYNSAIPYYEKGLETSIALYGEISLKTSDCYLNLGIVYQNINQIESSLKMLKTCYEIRKSILEETDYNVIVVLSMIQKLENTEEN